MGNTQKTLQSNATEICQHLNNMEGIYKILASDAEEALSKIFFDGKKINYSKIFQFVDYLLKKGEISIDPIFERGDKLIKLVPNKEEDLETEYLNKFLKWLGGALKSKHQIEPMKKFSIKEFLERIIDILETTKKKSKKDIYKNIFSKIPNNLFTILVSEYLDSIKTIKITPVDRRPEDHKTTTAELLELLIISRIRAKYIKNTQDSFLKILIDRLENDDKVQADSLEILEEEKYNESPRISISFNQDYHPILTNQNPLYDILQLIKKMHDKKRKGNLNNKFFDNFLNKLASIIIDKKVILDCETKDVMFNLFSKIKAENKSTETLLLEFENYYKIYGISEKTIDLLLNKIENLDIVEKFLSESKYKDSDIKKIYNLIATKAIARKNYSLAQDSMDRIYDPAVIFKNKDLSIELILPILQLKKLYLEENPDILDILIDKVETKEDFILLLQQMPDNNNAEKNNIIIKVFQRYLRKNIHLFKNINSLAKFFIDTIDKVPELNCYISNIYPIFLRKASNIKDNNPNNNEARIKRQIEFIDTLANSRLWSKIITNTSAHQTSVARNKNVQELIKSILSDKINATQKLAKVALTLNLTAQEKITIIIQIFEKNFLENKINLSLITKQDNNKDKSKVFYKAVCQFIEDQLYYFQIQPQAKASKSDIQISEQIIYGLILQIANSIDNKTEVILPEDKGEYAKNFVGYMEHNFKTRYSNMGYTTSKPKINNNIKDKIKQNIETLTFDRQDKERRSPLLRPNIDLKNIETQSQCKYR
jgi:hypothetical protein